MNRILHIVICGTVSLIQVSCDRKSEGVSEGESRMEVPERIEPKASPTAAEARPSADPADLVRKILKEKRGAAYDESIADAREAWAKMISTGKRGQALVDAKLEWARSVSKGLNSADQIRALVAFLDQRGEGDLKEWLLSEGLNDAFAGEDKEAMREWLKSMGTDHRSIAEPAGLAAGRGFLGDEEGLKQFLESLSSIHVQSSVLTGYTIAYAATHPEEAVSKFLSLRPGKVDMTGITQVMAALPPNTDFIAAGSGIPSDDQTLAKTARAAMLVNWAGTAPRDAAQYVMANTSKVHADQLGGIMEKWYVQESLEAARWAASLRTPEHRDAALAGEARAFAKEDLGRAWDAAGRISDLDRRIAAATPVYRIWSGRDPEGARQAWEQMFGE
jgi:hypothetical protein